MFDTEENCPDCEVRRVDPDDRDDDVRFEIEHCELHAFTATGDKSE